MTTVRILPEILSNQIAAGEVVERPVSVVKELIENSIDAGASHVIVEIKNGGKSLIRVSDDGIGLSRDDALLAIERYATSKLFNNDDLFSIATMGFRGEALPSIASVSKFSITTRTAQNDTGTRLEIHGGKLKDVSDAGAPVGTMVEVKALFFNTPARKKFLKSDATEISHIADTVSGIALGNPDIHFKLISNGRVLKHYPFQDGLFQRTINVLGKEVADKLYPLEYDQGGLNISGYCANPMFNRSTSSRIYLFVNNRLIYDRGLVSAIFQGYSGRIMKGKFPLSAVFVTIDFDQVDVNVHPSKKQVRFFNHQLVYQAVSMSVAQALAKAQQKESQYSQVSFKESESYDNGEQHTAVFEKKHSFGGSDETIRNVEQSVIEWEPVEHSSNASLAEKPSVTPLITKKSIQAEKIDHDMQITPDYLRILGQVMGTYILVETSGELRLIDQHAAHERIIYESLIKRHSSIERVSQHLIVPETIELSFKEADAIKGILDDLADLGFLIEPFGGTTYVIKGVPSVIDEKQSQPIVMEIIETVLQETPANKDQWFKRILAAMACHSAVRANKTMTIQEMSKLIQDLEQCENPMHCPHGRPAVITMTRKELEKLFKRVV